MKQANVTDPSKCYFIDDNRGNIDGARAQGWGRCVHFREQGLEAMEGGRTKQIGSERETEVADNAVEVVTTLEGLRSVWPEIFKQ
jgi:pyrimidine and pyridine-specific 5'-nucleotidase